MNEFRDLGLFAQYYKSARLIRDGRSEAGDLSRGVAGLIQFSRARSELSREAKTECELNN